MAMIDRHRDESSELRRRYGGTTVRTLRAIYGGTFAAGFSPNATLADILFHLDQYSLQRLVEDHDAGKLGDRIERQTKAAA